jgi:hypothetical protein
MGFFYDRFGPRWTALIAGFLLFCGYLFIGLSLIFPEKFATHFLVYCALLFMVGQGSFCTYITALSTNVKNFSEKHRTKV